MGQEKKGGSQLALILLCVLVFIFACCAFVFVALYFVKYGEDKGSDDRSMTNDDAERAKFISTTEANINIASLILKNADLSLDPCEDFFAYACSNYVRYTPIPESGSVGTWSGLQSGTNWKLKAALEKEYDMTKLPEITKHAKNLYNSCMNTEKIEELGTTPLRDMIDFFGGFPAVDPNWDPSSFDLTDLIAKTIRTAPWNTLFFTVNVFLPQTDNSVYGMNIQQSFLFFVRRIYLEPRNSTTLMAYEKYATDIAVLLGADPAAAAAEMKAMVDWEVAMAPNQVPAAEYWDISNFKYVTVAELYSNFTDKIDWIRLLGSVFEQTDKRFQMNDTIELHHSPWFERLSQEVENFGDDDKRAIANGLLVKLINSVESSLPESFRAAKETYNKARSASTGRKERWNECVEMASSPLFTEWGTARLYMEDNYDQSFQAEADRMVAFLKEEMEDMIDQAEWIDETTRAKAKRKLAAMNAQVGFPEYALNEEKLNSFIPDLTTNEDTQLANIRAAYTNYKLFWLSKLGKPRNKEDWGYSPILFNAAYFRESNTIWYPAIAFAPPLFHKDQLRRVNYAMSGLILGHEISHGFDNMGKNFDENGIFNAWFTPLSDEKYNNKSKCFIDQYAKFEIDGEKVKGENSLGENIADQGGLTMALGAYKKWLKTEGIASEPHLPGIDLTQDQTFFLSTAQFFCYSATEGIMKNGLSGRNPPYPIRLNGLIQNTPEFSQAFNCPADSPMNPTEKCNIWR